MVGTHGQQLQMDLVIMSVGKTEKGREMIRQNDGYQNTITSIEILSRFAFMKKLKTKKGQEVAEAMNEILKEFKDRFGEYPEVVQFDDGSEFYNQDFKGFLKRKKRENGEGIKYFSTLSKKSERRDDEDEDEKKYNESSVLLNRKAALVERLNRTLKTMMWKYFTQYNTKR